MAKYKVFVDYGQGGIRKTTSIVLEAETGGDAEQIAANMYNPVNRVSHTLIPETNYSSDSKTNSSSGGKDIAPFIGIALFLLALALSPFGPAAILIMDPQVSLLHSFNNLESSVSEISKTFGLEPGSAPDLWQYVLVFWIQVVGIGGNIALYLRDFLIYFEAPENLTTVIVWGAAIIVSGYICYLIAKLMDRSPRLTILIYFCWLWLLLAKISLDWLMG